MTARRRRVACGFAALAGTWCLFGCHTSVNYGLSSFNVTGQVTARRQNCIDLHADVSGTRIECFTRELGSPGQCVTVSTHNGPGAVVQGGINLLPAVKVRAGTAC
jgi:hypothetical protein